MISCKVSFADMSDKNLSKINQPDPEEYQELLNKLKPKERKFWLKYIECNNATEAYMQISPKDENGNPKIKRAGAGRSAHRMLQAIKKKLVPSNFCMKLIILGFREHFTKSTNVSKPKPLSFSKVQSVKMTKERLLNSQIIEPGWKRPNYLRRFTGLRKMLSILMLMLLMGSCGHQLFLSQKKTGQSVPGNYVLSVRTVMKMAAEPNIIWEPHPGSQELFMTCPIFECLYEGNRGPGKTDALLMDYAQYVGCFGEAWRGILFRETYENLKDVIAKSQKWFPRIFPKAKYNDSKHYWRWPDGEMLFFSYAKLPKDYWNYHGHEYPWIGWEELTNWASLQLYLDMMSCCRSSFSGIPLHYRSTTNPFGPGHNVVKMRFIDQAEPGEIIVDETIHPKLGKIINERVYIHGDRSENTHLQDADPDYEKRLNNITDPNKRKAWISGLWEILAGGMFDDVWDQNVHWLSAFQIPKSWTIYRAFDWGSARPFSVGWWAVSDGCEVTLANGKPYHFPKKTLFRIHEWYGWNGEANEGIHLANNKIGEGIREREEKHPLLAGREISKGPADSSIWDDDDGTCIAEKINAGFHGTENKKKTDIFIHANKKPGSRVKRWQVIRDMLTAAKEKNKESPGMYVFNTCRQFKRTIPTLQRDEKNPEDIDSNSEDHIADETGYMVITPIYKSGSVKVTGV